jgi:high-affinity iron transporter
MASVEADVDATKELLGILSPLIDTRAPDLLARADLQLTRLDAACAATQQVGAWVPLAKIPLAQREQVNAAIDTALGILDVLPDILRIQGNNQ